MFVRHSNDIKNNEFIPIRDKKRVIVCENQTYSLVDNVCPHQKSLISPQAGKGIRTCPYHGWSFHLNGQPMGSGKTSCKNEVSLDAIPLFKWNHLLFTAPIDPPVIADFSNLVLEEHRVDVVNSNEISIMDVFLDVDHIPLVHKGVYDQIGLTNAPEVQWEYLDWGSVQYVKRDTSCSEEFQKTLLPEEIAGQYGAIWIAVYPGTMIEWQPGAVFITVTGTTNGNQTPVQVYKYRDSRYSKQNWKMNTDVWELAWSQDKQLAELITEVAVANLEEQKLHFRKTIGLIKT